MGRRRSLYMTAAEFTDLVVQQQLIEHSDPGDTSVLETLSRQSYVASFEDADTVVISIKVPGGAIVPLDVSQHCTKSCDRRLEVHGSHGCLRLDNQNALGISSQGPALSLDALTQAGRYRDAYRELSRHFLRTRQGKEPPAVTKEQLLGALRVAAAAEPSWCSRSAVALCHDAIEASVVKTEAP